MLTGENVVLTGANGDIGRAILARLAENHANVWCLVRQESDDFANYVSNLERNNHIWIEVIQMNLEYESDVKRAVKEISGRKEKISTLINNAAVNYTETFLRMPIADLERVFKINFTSQIELIQLISRKMLINKRGNIINITSVSGFEHNTGNFAYAASKAVMNWATETMSRELAPYNIRVNAIAPGTVDTKINDGKKEVIESLIIPKLNLKRWGKCQEIADVVLFLLSDKASYISGQIIKVDGGRF